MAALARAHSVLAQNRWEGADLAQILADEISAFERPGQLTWQGPPVTLSPEAVQPVSLLIHELATNAVKRGALSVEHGTVEVHWRMSPGGRLEFQWKERGDRAYGKLDGIRFNAHIAGHAPAAARRSPAPWQSSGLELFVNLPAGVCRVHVRPSPSHEEEVAASVPPENIGPASTLDEAFGIMAEDLPPHAAVLDVNLKGQLVYPFADLLRSRAIPIVFCTGYEDIDARYGEHSVVRKPADLKTVGRGASPDDRSAARRVGSLGDAPKRKLVAHNRCVASLSRAARSRRRLVENETSGPSQQSPSR